MPSTEMLPAAEAELARSIISKLNWRVLPFVLVLYIIAMIDRTNVSFAALQMNEDLGFSKAVYGFGAGIFFLGYALFEIPSNLILARVGARKWIARILVTWGLFATAMMFVSGPMSFYTLRFLLGVARSVSYGQRLCGRVGVDQYRGLAKDLTDSYAAGLILLSVLLVLGAAAVLRLRDREELQPLAVGEAIR